MIAVIDRSLIKRKTGSIVLTNIQYGYLLQIRSILSIESRMSLKARKLEFEVEETKREEKI